jgi:hypothetical protein
LQRIDNEITRCLGEHSLAPQSDAGSHRFIGAAKPDKQFTRIFIDNATGNIALFNTHIVVIGTAVASGEATS